MSRRSLLASDSTLNDGQHDAPGPRSADSLFEPYALGIVSAPRSVSPSYWTHYTECGTRRSRSRSTVAARPQTRGEYEPIDAEIADAVDDYRREAGAGFFEAGAWRDALEEWGDRAGVSPAEFGVVEDHGLIDEFESYWDPASDEVGYPAPTLPDTIGTESGDSGEVDMGLDSPGRIASETLDNDCLLREANEFGCFDDDQEAYEDREE